MGYKCNGKWVVELEDLITLRRGIARLYNCTRARDVPHWSLKAQLTDRFAFTRVPTKPMDPMVYEERNMIEATRETVVIDGDEYDVWKYNDIALCHFFVRSVR